MILHIMLGVFLIMMNDTESQHILEQKTMQIIEIFRLLMSVLSLHLHVGDYTKFDCNYSYS